MGLWQPPTDSPVWSFTRGSLALPSSSYPVKWPSCRSRRVDALCGPVRLLSLSCSSAWRPRTPSSLSSLPKHGEDEGKDRMIATVDACRARLQPIFHPGCSAPGVGQGCRCRNAGRPRCRRLQRHAGSGQPLKRLCRRRSKARLACGDAAWGSNMVWAECAGADPVRTGSPRSEDC